MVDFDEVYVNAVSEVSIHLPDVIAQATVIYLVNVFRFPSKYVEESENFLEIAVSRTFRRPTSQP